MNSSSIRHALLSGILCVFALKGTQAADVATAFSIDAKPLAEALMDFGTQAGKVIVAPTALTSGKTAKPIAGEMVPEQALQQLLEGSGLGFSQTPEGTIVIVSGDSPAAREARNVENAGVL